MNEYEMVFSLDEDPVEELLPVAEVEELDENELELDEEEIVPLIDEEEEL